MEISLSRSDPFFPSSRPLAAEQPLIAQPADALRRAAPGVALAAAVAIAAYGLNRAIGTWVPIPAMVLALLIGIALYPVAARPVCRPGLVFCGKVLLRWAGAGLRPRGAAARTALPRPPAAPPSLIC